MPRYHVVVAAVGRPNGGTECLSSIRPGRMGRYRSTSPMGAFQWPMDTMHREQGELAMNYEETLDYVHRTGRPYWIGRFYKSYSGLLDGYIMFSGGERYYHFIMDYDPQHVQVGVDYDGYPTPAHFYLARNAIMTGTSWTIEEYNAVPDPEEPIPAAPIPAAPAAAPPAAAPAAPIAEGGSVFLCKGLFLFVFHFSPGPDSPFSFLIVRLFPFLGFLSLSYLASNLIISISLLSRFSTTAFWSLVSTSTFGFETLSSNFHGSICFLRFSSYAFPFLFQKGSIHFVQFPFFL